MIWTELRNKESIYSAFFVVFRRLWCVDDDELLFFDEDDEDFLCRCLRGVVDELRGERGDFSGSPASTDDEELDASSSSGGGGGSR